MRVGLLAIAGESEVPPGDIWCEGGNLDNYL